MPFLSPPPSIHIPRQHLRDRIGIIELLDQILGPVGVQCSHLSIVQIAHPLGACVEAAVREEIEPGPGPEAVSVQKGLALLEVPELEPARRSGGHQVSSIGRKARVLDRSEMALHHTEAFSGLHLPEPNTLVITSARHLLPIR